MNLLKVEDVYNLRIGLTIHKAVLCNELTFVSDIHSYNTRNCDSLRVPGVNLSRSEMNWKYKGIQFWNSIPDNIKQCLSLNRFKYMLTEHLFSSY